VLKYKKSVLKVQKIYVIKISINKNLVLKNTKTIGFKNLIVIQFKTSILKKLVLKHFSVKNR